MTEREQAERRRHAIEAERTGELFHFRHRGAPEHHTVLLLEGADTRFADCAALWNAAEAAERRKDSQVAREVVLALPADRGVSTEDRVDLARTFAEEHFVSKGLAVQLDVHAPHKDRGEGEGTYAEGTGGDHTNLHSHLLVTTRRVEGAGLAAKKARDLDPEVAPVGTRPGTSRPRRRRCWGTETCWRCTTARRVRRRAGSRRGACESRSAARARTGPRWRGPGHHRGMEA